MSARIEELRYQAIVHRNKISDIDSEILAEVAKVDYGNIFALDPEILIAVEAIPEGRKEYDIWLGSKILGGREISPEQVIKAMELSARFVAVPSGNVLGKYETAIVAGQIEVNPREKRQARLVIKEGGKAVSIIEPNFQEQILKPGQIADYAHFLIQTLSPHNVHYLQKLTETAAQFSWAGAITFYEKGQRKS